MKCKLLVHNSKKNENEWIDGEVTGTIAGELNENFERINVKTARGFYKGCHPDCVKIV